MRFARNVIRFHPAPFGWHGLCVWRVTNAPAPFYLVGTIYALSGKDYPLPKPYAEALHNSQKFFFEIPPDPKGQFPSSSTTRPPIPMAMTSAGTFILRRGAFSRKDSGDRIISGKAFWFGEHYIPGLQNLRS